MVAAQSPALIPLWFLLIAIPVAAILGDQCGYLIGRTGGPAVFDRPSAKRLGPAQLARAQVFFENYGARTVLLARFVPLMRTLAPVMAGASGMNYRTFTTYNLLGGVAWGVAVPLLGYLPGRDFVRPGAYRTDTHRGRRAVDAALARQLPEGALSATNSDRSIVSSAFFQVGTGTLMS